MNDRRPLPCCQSIDSDLMLRRSQEPDQKECCLLRLHGSQYLAHISSIVYATGKVHVSRHLTIVSVNPRLAGELGTYGRESGSGRWLGQVDFLSLQLSTEARTGSFRLLFGFCYASAIFLYIFYSFL